ncbi:Carbamoyl-phosphate synthase large chain [gamma proteobacterium IMCC1989]|nr:Carbamoyl-phosphate synthase large chain [gamma proteobacterium IMCC1989]
MVATRGTYDVLTKAGLQAEVVNKVAEGRPHIVDMIKNDEISLIINTTEGRQATKDSSSIRRSAESHFVYYTTTLAGGDAVSQALRVGGNEEQVRSLQSLHQRLA